MNVIPWAVVQVAEIAAATWLARTGHLTIRKPAPARPPRSPSGQAPPAASEPKLGGPQ